MEKNEPLTLFENLDEGEDRVCFFSRTFGGERVVIIPKERYLFNETESTYILTLKKQP